MMYSEDQELNEQERAAIAALPRELAPGDLLEERVVRALRNEGRFGVARSQHSWRKAALRIAAAIALFAGGVATGHFALSQPPTPTPTKQASAQNPEPTIRTGTRSVRTNETIIAEREMWL